MGRKFQESLKRCSEPDKRDIEIADLRKQLTTALEALEKVKEWNSCHCMAGYTEEPEGECSYCTADKAIQSIKETP